MVNLVLKVLLYMMLGSSDNLMKKIYILIYLLLSIETIYFLDNILDIGYQWQSLFKIYFWNIFLAFIKKYSPCTVLAIAKLAEIFEWVFCHFQNVTDPTTVMSWELWVSTLSTSKPFANSLLLFAKQSRFLSLIVKSQMLTRKE